MTIRLIKSQISHGLWCTIQDQVSHPFIDFFLLREINYLRDRKSKKSYLPMVLVPLVPEERVGADGKEGKRSS